MNRFTSFVVLSALYASAATAQSPSECAPTGEIVAAPARGTLTGNRGILGFVGDRLAAPRWTH